MNKPRAKFLPGWADALHALGRLGVPSGFDNECLLSTILTTTLKFSQFR